MREKIQACLKNCGFGKLELSLAGIQVYYAIENNFINAVILADIEADLGLTSEKFDLVTQKIDWKTGNGESIDVHTLFLIFTSDIAAARELSRNNHFCWYIDMKEKQLIIEADKCEDFYGMRARLQDCIASPDFFVHTAEAVVTEEAPDSEPPKNPQEYTSGEDSGNFRDTVRATVVNFCFISANVLLYILCIFVGDFFYDKGILDVKAVLQDGQWYRLLTSTFLHADATHLVSNMLYLYLLGDIMERALGHIKYFLMYMGSGLIASVFSLGFSYMVQDYTASLGSSGAVFGVTGALLWIALRNRGEHEIITVPKIIFLIIYSLYTGFVGSNINNAAHVGGVIGGFLLAVLLYRKKKDKPVQQSKKREEEEN